MAKALFQNAHDEWPLTETKSTTNYGRVCNTEERKKKFECLNLTFLFVTCSSEAEVLTTFLVQCRYLLLMQ